MAWAYQEWGDSLYEAGVLKQREKAILNWCEDNELSLSAKNRKKLFKLETWQKQASLIQTATRLMGDIGSEEFSDFNQFKQQIDQVLKANKLKLSAGEKNAIVNAVSWYDETAEKVINSKIKLSGDKLDKLLGRLGCHKEDLADFGYYETDVNDEFITYETATDLRDSENVPLAEDIHDYFLREVKPHVAEAWIDSVSYTHLTLPTTSRV